MHYFFGFLLYFLGLLRQYGHIPYIYNEIVFSQCHIGLHINTAVIGRLRLHGNHVSLFDFDGVLDRVDVKILHDNAVFFSWGVGGFKDDSRIPLKSLLFLLHLFLLLRP